MLSKQFRLNLRKESDFFQKCKKAHTPYFSFFFVPSNEFKATVIVSKKIATKASQRNAIKRKFRSAVTANLDFLTKLKINLAIVVHEKGADLSVSEITQQIQENAEKIRI